MTELKPWPGQAFLDALRPDDGGTVNRALLSSCSADVVSIVAALLALTGFNDDRGSGTKANFAEAVERLRGKARIVIQRGRLARSRRVPAVAGILDQFVQEVPFDERERSWHPKIALVEHELADKSTEWRLWLGSRNLTAVENLDFGLLLIGQGSPVGRAGTKIAGVGDLASRLASRARLPETDAKRLRKEIDGLWWRPPLGVQVHSVTLTDGADRSYWPSFENPADISEVIAVSPFLDGGTVGAMGAWGGEQTRRSLLSIMPELSKIAAQAKQPLKAFSEVAYLDAPAPESLGLSDGTTEDGKAPEQEQEPDVEEEVRLGLHAKIIAVRRGKSVRMWVGSANATGRAWQGANAEVIAELSSDPKIFDGLRELLGRASLLSAAQLQQLETVEKDEVSERLDEARKAVVGAWTGTLVRDGDAFTIRCEEPPHPPDPEVQLEVGLATGPLLLWPRGQEQLALGAFPKSRHTELLQLRLCLRETRCSWMQRVTVAPPLEDDRDRAALSEHLGPNSFLEWVAGLMRGDDTGGGGGEPWDADPPPPNGSSAAGWNIAANLLTVESMLACWARDKAAFKIADARLRTYLDPIIAQAEAAQSEDAARLKQLKAIWTKIRTELLKVK